MSVFLALRRIKHNHGVLGMRLSRKLVFIANDVSISLEHGRNVAHIVIRVILSQKGTLQSMI